MKRKMVVYVYLSPQPILIFPLDGIAFEFCHKTSQTSAWIGGGGFITGSPPPRNYNGATFH